MVAVGMDDSMGGMSVSTRIKVLYVFRTKY